MKKVPYLETLPEKFPLKRGSGSYNTGCPTPTGSRIAAILQPKKDSSSLTETQSSAPLEDTLEEMRAKELENLLENGNNGVTNSDLLRFWETRIPVPQKG